jgi:hypothetical protein
VSTIPTLRRRRLHRETRGFRSARQLSCRDTAARA